jgi:hypothetical protein
MLWSNNTTDYLYGRLMFFHVQVICYMRQISWHEINLATVVLMNQISKLGLETCGYNRVAGALGINVCL